MYFKSILCSAVLELFVADRFIVKWHKIMTNSTKFISESIQENVGTIVGQLTEENLCIRKHVHNVGEIGTRMET